MVASLRDCVDFTLSRLVLLVERCLLVRRVLLAIGEVCCDKEDRLASELKVRLVVKPCTELAWGREV